ncbi:MAG: T9SS type A sorting domain-containing protein [Bacteroidia bacterium]|nr:T9SS type A sorting domain-containing protein [Bacteroidia bacterium]
MEQLYIFIKPSRRYRDLFFSFPLILILCMGMSYAQGSAFCDGSVANAGNIKLNGDFGNPTLLNPDAGSGDANIFQGGSYNALSGVPEMDQFEDLISLGFNDSGFDQSGIYPCSQTNLDWIALEGVVNGEEPHNDLSGGSACGATDIVHNGSNAGYGFYTIVDQDCNPTTSTDAYLIIRMRIAKESAGAFGFSLLVDTDNSCNGWIPDVGSNCASHCFDREIWLGTGGGNTGLHIKNISGGVSPGTEVGFIDISETQVACTALAPAACKTGNHSTIFYTFGVPLSDLGVTSGSFDLGLAPATSNSPDDVIDGNYAFSDVGGVDGSAADATGCNCTGLTGDCLNACILTCATNSNNAVFPVEYLDLVGEYVGQEILLSWSTARELNNQKFEIERLDAFGEFVQIGEKVGNGTTQETSRYVFRDQQPLLGSNYYRLKQIDFDGQFHYSSILEVRPGGSETEIRINPAVVQDELGIDVLSSSNESYELQILSVNGQILFSEKQAFQKGSQRLYFSADNLSSGMYFVRLMDITGRAIAPAKFIKY